MSEMYQVSQMMLNLLFSALIKLIPPYKFVMPLIESPQSYHPKMFTPLVGDIQMLEWSNMKFSR